MKMIVDAKFQVKLATLIWWTKFTQKGYFRSENEKVNTTIEFCIFELVSVLNFNLRLKIIVGTKFQLKLTILTWWTKFAK